MTAPFDIDSLHELWGQPPDALFAHILGLIRAEAPRLCAAAAGALAAEQRADLQRHAHTLKGAAGNVGAVTLATLAATLAAAAPTAPRRALALHLADLVREWRRVAAVIDAGGPHG